MLDSDFNKDAATGAIIGLNTAEIRIGHGVISARQRQGVRLLIFKDGEVMPFVYKPLEVSDGIVFRVDHRAFPEEGSYKLELQKENSYDVVKTWWVYATHRSTPAPGKGGISYIPERLNDLEDTAIC